jgi:hypothetical protein
MCQLVKKEQKFGITDRPYIGIQVGIGSEYITIAIGKKVRKWV